LGTSFGRECYKNTWIDLTLRNADEILKGDRFYSQIEGLRADYMEIPGGVVIPDVRFRNEMEAIRAAGGVVIRLKRQTDVAGVDVGVKNHSSETEQLEIPDEELDYVLNVPYGIRAYHDAIQNLMTEIACDALLSVV
jgi:hypothetical protein